MAMGTRQSEQASLWIATGELPKSPGHPFYTRLNALLAPPTSIGSSKAQEQSQPSLRSSIGIRRVVLHTNIIACERSVKSQTAAALNS